MAGVLICLATAVADTTTMALIRFGRDQRAASYSAAWARAFPFVALATIAK
jgi:hypothetical protein